MTKVSRNRQTTRRKTGNMKCKHEFDDEVCYKCGKLRPKPDVWACSKCKKINPEGNKVCDICGTKLLLLTNVESLVGWTYKGWLKRFHHDEAIFIEMQFPAIYKEEQKGMVRVRITIEECND